MTVWRYIRYIVLGWVIYMTAPSAAESTDRLIKGKTTFGEILGWGVSQASIETVLGKPMPTVPTTLVKDFCTANSLDFEVIKPALQAEVNKIK